MITNEQVGALYGSDVYDRDGDRIGEIGAVWGDATGTPTWASVRTGLFGLGESLFPLRGADLRAGRVTVPYEKRQVKDAPNVDADHDEPLEEDEVERLYAHYGLNSGTAGRTDHDWDHVNRADDAMTRSEERLEVGTEREAVGRARLRKYVTTEQQQVRVPVAREEVRLEREPITAANRDRAYSGPELSESEHEVTLHAERPVVDRETVPVERVRLGTETVTDERTVDGEIRKEHIEADIPGDRRGRHAVD
ncbi:MULTISPECIES: PRC and DUF2382 domain-containing protein [Actinoplanes]|uniref:DUF2382 domain-containing protein n=1 Tax=Actinoplanes TaxID=1865 RepID=UPI0005F2B492|nr:MULTISPECIES: PRC and DUF2382 domain-containing protein [Actinoplanes]GLX99791.1 hypothetical protein Acsp01_01710 [Actinoplanes sp. NBRC 101535]